MCQYPRYMSCPVCVCVCVCVCARACVRACEHACVCVYVLVHASVVIFSTQLYVRYYFHELVSQEIKDVLFFGCVLRKLTLSSVQDGTCALQKDHKLCAPPISLALI